MSHVRSGVGYRRYRRVGGADTDEHQPVGAVSGGVGHGQRTCSRGCQRTVNADNIAYRGAAATAANINARERGAVAREARWVYAVQCLNTGNAIGGKI